MISKKIAIIVGIVLFVLSATGSYLFFNQQIQKAISLSQYKTTTPDDTSKLPLDSGPKTEACPVNGALYSKAQRQVWEARRPLGVMIENHTDARPQSGLSSSDVLYEAVAEGGITRFLAIFYCQDAKPIGPIRSARIYFLETLQEYGKYPLYSHVGGANSPGPADALGEIRQLGWDQYNDLNQFGVPFPYYYRDYERLPNVATEHTMYSSTGKLWEFAKKNRKLTNVDDKGKAWNTGFTPWKFQDDAKAEERGNVGKISFGFWERFPDFNVVWQYNKESNSYKRVNGGKPHMDKDTGKQLTAKNIVVVLAKESVANDGYEKGQHLLYEIIGTGNGYLFQNGNAAKITWKKKDPETRMRFYDQTGKEMSFVRGQIFVEITPKDNTVTY